MRPDSRLRLGLASPNSDSDSDPDSKILDSKMSGLDSRKKLLDWTHYTKTADFALLQSWFHVKSKYLAKINAFTEKYLFRKLSTYFVDLLHTVWKFGKFSLTEKMFREINSLATSFVKMLLPRNFCQKTARLIIQCLTSSQPILLKKNLFSKGFTWPDTGCCDHFSPTKKILGH